MKTCGRFNLITYNIQHTMETLYTFLNNFSYQHARYVSVSGKYLKMDDERLSKMSKNLTKKGISEGIPGENATRRYLNSYIEQIQRERNPQNPNTLKPDIPLKIQPEVEVASSTSKAKYTKKSPYWTKKKLGLLAGGVLGAGAIGLGTKMYLDRRNKKR